MVRGSEPSKVLGAAVRSARTRRGLTQEALARGAHVGTSTLRQVEAGNASGPSLYAVLRLVAALGEDVDLLESTLDACRSLCEAPR